MNTAYLTARPVTLLSAPVFRGSITNVIAGGGNLITVIGERGVGDFTFWKLDLDFLFFSKSCLFKPHPAGRRRLLTA